MTDLQRLNEVFDYLKSNKYFRNQQDFVERIGSDKATVSQILNGKKEINKHFVCKISTAFPIVSEDWILMESGEMLKYIPDDNQKETISELQNNGIEVNKNPIPYEFVQSLFEEQKARNDREMELIRQNGVMVDLLKEYIEELKNK